MQPGRRQRVVTVALEQLQYLAPTRVRKEGQRTDRTMGNVLDATFRHETSRALHLHELYCNGVIAHVCRYTLRQCG
jgi:hypothetical protein